MEAIDEQEGQFKDNQASNSGSGTSKGSIEWFGNITLLLLFCVSYCVSITFL